MRMFLMALLISVIPGMGFAAKRLGLIIGNDSYLEVPTLQKARSDARAMSQSLSRLGFEAITVLDANRREMNRAISNFTARLQPGDTALIFYAGHGVEIDGENYLLPTDIVSPLDASADFVKFESISLSNLLFRVQKTGARTTLMFLDACRDNPFATEGGRSIGGSRGLARITAPEGTFVVYSAGAQQQALDSLHADDPDDNSVFTRLLLPKLDRPGLELRDLVAELRVEVRDLARTRQHSQFPAYYDELLGDFFFAPASQELSPAPVAAQPLTPEISNNIHEDFRLTKSVHTAAAYRAFLQKYQAYPDALPVTLARQLLNGLDSKEGNEPDETQTQLARVPTAKAPATASLNLGATGQTREPTTEVAAAPASPVLAEPAQETPTKREIIRETQRQLNARGCNTGTPDGLIGRRTRTAFEQFAREAGISLDVSDLGTQAALNAVKSKSGRVCVTVAATPATPAAAPAKPTSKTSYNLSGNWRATTSGCVSVRKIRANLNQITASSYRFKSSVVGMPSDFGARGVVRLNGRNMRAELYSVEGGGDWSGTLAKDGKTFSVKDVEGCRYTFYKN